jgi:hypothetical protein
MLATVPVAATLFGAGTAHATECFTPGTRYDPHAGYCRPDDYPHHGTLWPGERCGWDRGIYMPC